MLDNLAIVVKPENINASIIIAARPFLVAMKYHQIAFSNCPFERGFLARIIRRHSLEIFDESLFAIGNMGIVLPDSLGRLKHLEELNLSRCQIVALPSSFPRLKHLKVLHLSVNELTSIPPETFSRMVRLKELFLSKNKLTALPDLSNCDQLEKFLCSDNLI